MTEKYKLTYFNLKAVAEPIRLIFAYAGVEYEDIRIERADWPEVKKSYPWGQLPVLQVGDKTLAQSSAICRNLASKFNLNGTSEWKAAQIDELSDALADFRQEFGKIQGESAEKDPAKRAVLDENFMNTVVPLYFGNLEARLGKNEESPYLVGKTLSWVDLKVAHYLDLFGTMMPTLVENFPKLAKLQKTVFAIPQIKAWVEKRPQTII